MEQTRINELLALVIAQAEQAGIPVSGQIDLEVRVNRRAKTRFGCCVRKDGRYYIEVAARVLDAGEEAVCQVLAHEVLHTCKGCADHGTRWRAYAGEMNARYGYAIRRTDTFDRLGLEDDRPVKYVVVCQRCGARLCRMKRSALVKHPERYRCKCGGALRLEEG